MAGPFDPDFFQFYLMEWQDLLKGVEMHGGELNLEPADKAAYPIWHRRAAYLFYQLKQSKGNAEMPRAKAKSANPLIAGLQFALTQVAPADKLGNVMIWQGRLYATDQIVTMSYPVETDIAALPAQGFADALSNVGETVQITVSVESGLSFVSDKYSAYVGPGVPFDMDLPQGPMYPLDDSFRVALEFANRLTKDGADYLYKASVLTRGNSLFATNGVGLVEAWHQNPMPDDLVLPKAFAAALVKVKDKIIGFSLSPDWSVLNIHFDSNLQLATRLFTERWPEEVKASIQAYFAGANTPEKIPAGLLTAIEKSMPFTTDGKVYLKTGEVNTSIREDFPGSSVAIAFPNVAPPYDGFNFNGKVVVTYKDVLKDFEYLVFNGIPLFFGAGGVVRVISTGGKPE